MALPVALQLYSVRRELERDYEGTIQKVAEMGYEGIELSEIRDDQDPDALKEMIHQYGLCAISCHAPFEDMLNEPDRIFERIAKVGCKYAAIPWLDKGTALTQENMEDTIAQIIYAGKKAKEKGLTLLYHNHDFEFQKTDGEYILDRIYREVPKEYLQTQLDTCWIKVAGEDPAEYIRKYAGRAPLVHLKDYTGSATGNLYGLLGCKDEEQERDGDFTFKPVGYGVQNMKSILEASEAAGAKWVVVEQDESLDIPALEAAAMSRKYLKSLGW